jgi:hypothetical protein
MSNEHTFSKSKKAKQKTEDEMKESFDSYLKSIEPYILLYFCFIVIPDMLARFEASDKLADENAGRN